MTPLVAVFCGFAVVDVEGTSPPRLLVTVTGIVRHLPPSKLSSQTISARSLPHYTTTPLPTNLNPNASNPTDTTIASNNKELEYVLPNPPSSALAPESTSGGTGKNRGKEMLDEAVIRGLPRTFVEVFELVADNERSGEGGSQPGVSCCLGWGHAVVSLSSCVDYGGIVSYQERDVPVRRLVTCVEPMKHRRERGSGRDGSDSATRCHIRLLLLYTDLAQDHRCEGHTIHTPCFGVQR